MPAKTISGGTDVRLRPAEPDELPDLSALCLRSKAVHGYSAPMMAAFRMELMVVAEDLETDQVVVAERAGGIVGLAQVSRGPDGCFLEKLFVEPDAIGSGVGRVLFDWAVEAACGLGAGEMIIESDPGAAKFYRAMGAAPAGTAKSGSIPGRRLPRLVMPLGDAQQQA